MRRVSSIAASLFVKCVAKKLHLFIIFPCNSVTNTRTLINNIIYADVLARVTNYRFHTLIVWRFHYLCIVDAFSFHAYYVPWRIHSPATRVAATLFSLESGQLVYTCQLIPPRFERSLMHLSTARLNLLMLDEWRRKRVFCFFIYIFLLSESFDKLSRLSTLSMSEYFWEEFLRRI